MNESSVNKQAATLSSAVSKGAIAAGAGVENRAAAKAAGLATGAFNQGGYTYNRVINPVVAPIQAALVTAAKQALFRQAAKNAMNVAQVRYDKEKLGVQNRQQAAQKKQYEERKAAEAAYYSSAGGGGGGVGGTGVGAGSTNSITSVNVSPSQAKTNNIKYIGNPDFRGWLKANGYQSLLAYTGNDGKIDMGKVNKSGADTPVFSYAPGQGGKVQAYVGGLYQRYKSLGGR